MEGRTQRHVQTVERWEVGGRNTQTVTDGLTMGQVGRQKSRQAQTVERWEEEGGTHRQVLTVGLEDRWRDRHTYRYRR